MLFTTILVYTIVIMWVQSHWNTDWLINLFGVCIVLDVLLAIVRVIKDK